MVLVRLNIALINWKGLIELYNMNHFNHHHHIYRYHHHHSTLNPTHPGNPLNPIYHHHRHHHNKDSVLDTTLVTTVESNASTIHLYGEMTSIQGGVLVVLTICVGIIAAMFIKHISKY